MPTPPPNPTDRQRCTARGKASGERCKAYAMRGQTICRSHGGKAPQNLAAAQRRLEAAAAVEAVQRLGIPVDTDPQQALLDELQQTAGLAAWLRRQLDNRAAEQNLTVDDIVDTTTWRAWNEQRQHLTKVAEACIRAGIAERQVRLAEQQGALLADVLRRIFDDPDLGLTPTQREAAGHVARRHLTAVNA